MKRNYIKPQSEIVTLCTGENIAIDSVTIGQGSITVMESERKNAEDDIDWDDWDEEE